MLLLKGHWKMCPWGRFTVATFQPSVCPKAWTWEIRVTPPCFCVETALWELLSCSHLNFNLYGQSRKERSLPVYYLLCFPVLFSSDAWDAISVLYRAQEIQHDWKPFASLLKSRSQFCGFAVTTNLSGCGKCYFQKFSALCAGHIKESSCFLASRMEFLLSPWNAILQWSHDLEL